MLRSPVFFPTLDLGTWAGPADLPGYIALGLSGYLVLRAATGWTLAPLSRARFLTLACFAAAFLSLGYVAVYLRGGPRIIDATMYFLQGRGLSHGMFTFSAQEVSASFRGRFLLFAEPDRLAGIFPPGYPALLALGFLVGAPMVIGPVLAALIAAATYALTRELCIAHPLREPIARLATILSVVCGALRYHTADTMSHGAAALGVTLALASALAARRMTSPTRRTRSGDARLWCTAGLFAGWVFSTRMPSALPIGAALVVLAWGDAKRARAFAWAAVGALPGVLLLLAANHAATGHALGSTQLAYYTASDGPPGCFRYGFGHGIGCVFEHGDFVEARLANGYGLLAALGTTLRRLRMHLTDVANLEPLALLVLLALRRTPGAPLLTAHARLAFAVVVGQIVAYAPFYFDGNYHGGGARLFADVLPIEHALLALAVLHIAPSVAYVRRAFALVALSALGFAVHASHEHLALAGRDGGRPMFEPDKLREAGISHGLVFFDTDHGFDLAHDPGVAPSHGVTAARLRDDDHDKLLHARLGHPIAHVYRLGPDGPSLAPFTRSGALTERTWRFESESDWPPLEQKGGWAVPEWSVEPCASNGRVLILRAAPGEPMATARIELPVPRARMWRLRPHVTMRGTGANGSLTVYDGADAAPVAPPVATWTWKDDRRACEPLAERTAELSPPRAIVSLVTNGEIALDYVVIDAVETAH